ncbi:hypothetical protein AMATHDRAFT_70102 [Amanita thiersii Skay4041]|uniref:Uncharacterized protein n=1 Tax=Amanita thiersii Skay4041 TaxID=703135 RepID=A0A2A9NFC7_9AGAR|nr:hypothetical protein AMATHDRAFT_70102 [Amanita thiersii Skay4041]
MRDFNSICSVYAKRKKRQNVKLEPSGGWAETMGAVETPGVVHSWTGTRSRS